MAANKEHEPHAPQLPDLGDPANRHESSDVDVVAVTRFGIGLVILCIATLLLVVGVFRYFLNLEKEKQPPPRPDAAARARRRPPEPRLESNPIPDLKAIREAEDQILNSYGWVDLEKGLVRIPVSEAIDLLVKRGLPARPPQAATRAPVTVPSESGMGTILQQPGGPLAPQLRALGLPLDSPDRWGGRK